MNVQWNEEQRALRSGFEPWYKALSNAGTDFASRWKLVRESGLPRLPFDRECGGRGLDLLSTMYILEGLGYGCRDAGLIFSLVTQLVSVGVPLQRYGSAEVKACYLPAICDGELITAHAITDPAGGSDVLGMQMTARPDGAAWILEGRKAFITNGPVASLLVVYAVTDRSAGPLGLTAFLVERDTPGLNTSPELRTMGLSSAPMCDLTFDGCRVPASHVLGGAGRGFLVLSHVMAWEVLCSFIVTVGDMRHRLERCVRYANERTAFGRPIATFQSVANRIVDMRIGMETAGRWLYDAAQAVQAHPGAGAEAEVAIAKLVTSEANVASALHAIQIFGGVGYLTETGLEQSLCDAVAGTIYSGSSEIQRTRIARLTGLVAS